MYDDSLHMNLLAETKVIGFADDAFVVCISENVGIQNVGAGGPYHRCLELIASSSFNQPMTVERRRNHELVGADISLVLGSLLQIATVEVIQCEADLVRLMPTIGESKETKRKLVGTVVHSKLLYAALV